MTGCRWYTEKMKQEERPSTDETIEAYDKPVAYGVNGEPLYARPLQQVQPGPQFVHMSRAVSPIEPEVSPEVKQRHDESLVKYPELNLSEQEYIISAVHRHPIGMLGPIIAAGLLVAVLAFLLGAYPAVSTQVAGSTGSALPDVSIVTLVATVFMGLAALGAYVACWVYLKNKFYLTNESVIQEIQTSLFTHNEQTVSLANVEDVSFEQKGIIQAIFNYGSIRLSTEGEESTYRFSYVAHPKQQTATLNNAVEAFKNGRPVSVSSSES